MHLTSIHWLLRIIKYLVNLAGLIWMMFGAMIGYGLYVRIPPCDQVMNTISEVVGELVLLYILYVVLLTIVNRLIERKVEKRTDSKEYVWLSIIQIFVLLMNLGYFSFQFYGQCK